MPPFTTLLSEIGYARSTIQTKLRQVAALNHWLAQRKLRVEAVNEERIAEFLAESPGSQAVFGTLLESLRKAGLVAPREPEAPESPHGLLLHRFVQYLEQERGLAQSTVSAYCRDTRLFLGERFGADPPRLAELSTADVTAFVVSSVGRGRAKTRGRCLRSFLRFLRQEGEITTDLAGAVPTVSARSFSARLPASLESGQVKQILSCCDRSTTAGLRDYAILLVLARLGLRAGELADMELEDLDWRAGTLTVRGKGSRLDRLPIPQDVGEALTSYLRDGRPRCPSPQVFLRLRAPYRGLVSAAIGAVVRQALLRAGLSPARKGAHLLRHSLATKRLSMVRGFASYLIALDSRTEIPAKGLLPHSYRRKTPYLYSDCEVDQLLEAAQKLPSATGLRAATYATFLGLLAVTGMRMGEAVHLDREDVDLAQGLLTLRQTKSGQSRYVPIHPSTQQALLGYQTHRERIYPKPQTDSFFLSEPGRRLSKAMVRETFVKLSRQVGLRGPSQSHGPRLHDLRHRFAVCTLVSWYRSGIDVEAQIPKLSTYLGHTHVHDTYWYLTAVPELLECATLRLEQNPTTEPKP